MYKFLLRLDYCVHAGQVSAAAGKLGQGWKISACSDNNLYILQVLIWDAEVLLYLLVPLIVPLLVPLVLPTTVLPQVVSTNRVMKQKQRFAMLSVLLMN